MNTSPENPSPEAALDKGCETEERRLETTRVRHQAEAAGRESGEWLRLALSSARAGVWEWNLLTQEVIWSPELFDLLGLPRGSIDPSFNTFTDVIHPADRERTISQFEEAAARGGPFHLELRVIRSDGAEMWFSSVGHVEHDAGGTPVLAMGINQDITARKQVELDAAFWAELGERIRLSADAEELMWTVAQATARHLRVTRCHFVELDEAAGLWLIHRDAHDESVPSIAGQYPATSFSPSMLDEARAGQSLVCADTHADPRTSGEYAAGYEAVDARAFVAIPLLREGCLAAMLVINSQTPRVWSAAEVTLLETVAERTWNVVEKLRLDASLRESEAMREAALDGGRLGVWSWDPLTGQATADRRALDLLGLDLGSFTGDLSVVLERIHPEDRPGVTEALEQAQQPGGEYYAEFRVVLPGGPVRWVAGTGRARLGAEGQVKQIHGVTFDITERKRGELNTRFLLELDTVLAPLAGADEIEQAAVDRLGAHLEIDQCYFGHITGKRVDIRHEYRRGRTSLLGEYDLHDFISTEGQEQAEVVPVVIDDVTTDPRTVSSSANYAAIGVGAFISAPVKYHDHWVGSLNCGSRGPRAWRPDELHLMQDLAARVWPLIEQARVTRALREADRRKDEFLAMLAHELRNPLAPIRNAAQVLKLFGPADPRQQWAREVIERQIQHLTRLVDDLLDVSRITQGKVKITREPLDLATIIHRAVEASRPLIEARHHQLAVAVPPEPVRIDGDLTRLVQVIANLLNNAAKYTEEGGHIRIDATREDGEAVIRVRDNGMGLPADLLPHVFDLFTQADRSLDRSQGGLGIGLTLVRQLVDLHGGRVEARSDGPGQGSEFIVRLPAAPTAVAAAEIAPGERPASAAAARGLKILVVEDNLDLAEMMSFLLELKGHVVRTVHDGPEALKAACAFQPEAVLCDIGLPGMNGYEVAARLREQPAFKETPLIALTGYGQEEARDRAKAAGFDHHLVKPVEPEVLEALLDSLRTVS